MSSDPSVEAAPVVVMPLALYEKLKRNETGSVVIDIPRQDGVDEMVPLTLNGERGCCALR